eukprot:scaffold7381_cov310-Pinguiococcus_pyrenoidosus.AAC.66
MWRRPLWGAWRVSFPAAAVVAGGALSSCDGAAPEKRSAFSSFFGPNQRVLAKEQRRALAALHTLLESHRLAEKDDLDRLREAAEQLDDLFLVTFVGEWNSGKSTLINALLGDAWCEEGVTPTTPTVQILRYGEGSSRNSRLNAKSGVEDVWIPAEWLKATGVALVDTPGTNEVIRSHAELTTKFIPKADFVFFIASADRPFSASERLFLETIREWRKNVVIIINKMDIVETEEERARIIDYVKSNAASLLGGSSPVFPISAREAFRAQKAKENPYMSERAEEIDAMRKASGFEAFEAFIAKNLTADAKVRYKLLSPLGVGESIASRAAADIKRKHDDTQRARRILEQMDEKLEGFMADLKSATEFEMAQIVQELENMSARVERYLDQNVTTAGILADALFQFAGYESEFKKGLEKAIKGNTEESIDAIVLHLAELISKRTQKEGSKILSDLVRQSSQNKTLLASLQIAPSLFTEKDELESRLRIGIDPFLSDIIQGKQLEKLSKAVHTGLTLPTGFFGLSLVEWVGLKSFYTMSESVDLDEVLGPFMTNTNFALGIGLGLLMTVGAANVQCGRSKRAFRSKVKGLQVEIEESLGRHLDRELYRVQKEILNGGISEFRRAVELERDRLQKITEALQPLQEVFKEIRKQVT